MDRMIVFLDGAGVSWKVKLSLIIDLGTPEVEEYNPRGDKGDT